MKRILLLFLLISLVKTQSVTAQPFGNYARFDGIDDYFQSNLTLPQTDFTIEFFYRYCEDTLNLFRGIINSPKFHFAVSKYYFDYPQHYCTGCVFQSYGSLCVQSQYPAANEWNHFAIVYHSDEYNSDYSITYWCNGLEYSSSAPSELSNTDTGFIIGNALSNYFPFPDFFKGYIDEMRISSLLRYNYDFTPPTAEFTTDANTIALWHFNESDYQPDTIADASGNGYTLTAHGEATLTADYTANVSGNSTANTYSVYTYSIPDLPPYLSSSWNVVDGSILYTSADSIKVNWDSVGTGDITVLIHDSAIGGDIDTAQLTVTVICDSSHAFYADEDSDGYGNADVFSIGCYMPDGYLLDSTDCNDDDNTIHPGAPEIYGNGLDENCNGLADECQANFILYPDTLIPHHYWAMNMAAGTPPIAYTWNWGDGSADSTAYPSHTYADAGYYTICQTIHDSIGCINNICNDYQVLKISSEQKENTIVTVDVVAFPTAVSNPSVLQSWYLFPNPASAYVNVRYTLSLPSEVNIMLQGILGNEWWHNFTGQMEAGEQHLEIDTREFPDGIYVLQINTGDVIASVKVIVLH